VNENVRVRYDSNNSGGGWWLKDADWFALEEAGWVIVWAKDRQGWNGKSLADEDGRWLGALATGAYRDGLPEELAIAEWEYVTGQNADAEGCPCCGRPHSFWEEEAVG
jgi:hypothetical protein